MAFTRLLDLNFDPINITKDGDEIERSAVRLLAVQQNGRSRCFLQVLSFAPEGEASYGAYECRPELYEEIRSVGTKIKDQMSKIKEYLGGLQQTGLQKDNLIPIQAADPSTDAAFEKTVEQLLTKAATATLASKTHAVKPVPAPTLGM